MPDNKQQPQQPSQHPTDEDVLAHTLKSAEEFLSHNWLHLILILAIVGAGIVAWRVYSYRRQSHTMTAWGELGSLPGSELQFLVEPQQATQLRQEAITVSEDILKNSPHTSATPWLMLQVGSLQADSDDWTAASRAFSKLTTDYPESEAAEPGKAALAASLESLGKYKEAGDLYQSLAAGGTHPYRLLSAARCRELAGDLDAAKKLYEKVRDLKTKDEDLADMAVARLEDIGLGKRLLPPPPLKSAAPAIAAPVPALEPSALPTPPAGTPEKAPAPAPTTTPEKAPPAAPATTPKEKQPAAPATAPKEAPPATKPPTSSQQND